MLFGSYAFETKDLRPQTRDQRPETRKQRLETWDQWPETSDLRPTGAAQGLRGAFDLCEESTPLVACNCVALIPRFLMRCSMRQRAERRTSQACGHAACVRKAYTRRARTRAAIHTASPTQPRLPRRHQAPNLPQNPSGCRQQHWRWHQTACRGEGAPRRAIPTHTTCTHASRHPHSIPHSKFALTRRARTRAAIIAHAHTPTKSICERGSAELRTLILRMLSARARCHPSAHTHKRTSTTFQCDIPAQSLCQTSPCAKFQLIRWHVRA